MATDRLGRHLQVGLMSWLARWLTNCLRSRLARCERLFASSGQANELDQLGNAAGFHFPHDLRAAKLHRAEPNRQHLGDLLVRLPVENRGEDFLLGLGEFREPGLELQLAGHFLPLAFGEFNRLAQPLAKGFAFSRQRNHIAGSLPH